MNYALNKEEEILLKEIENSFYMKPTIKRILSYVKSKNNENTVWIEVFDQIYTILVEAKNEVEKLLNIKKKRG